MVVRLFSVTFSKMLMSSVKVGFLLPVVSAYGLHFSVILMEEVWCLGQNLDAGADSDQGQRVGMQKEVRGVGSDPGWEMLTIGSSCLALQWST